MEIWKDVVGGEGFYQVSSLGRVRSIARKVTRGNHKMMVAGGPIKACVDSHGYLKFNLRKDGTRLDKKVHVAVAEAFIGPRPDGMDVCHRDGKKTNCKHSNLRYGTRSQNHMDKVAHGTSSRGERSSAAKLNRRQVLSIRRRYIGGGISHEQLALKYGVSRRAIGLIISGENWGWL